MTATSSFPETKKDMPWTLRYGESSPTSKELVDSSFATMLEYADAAWNTANELVQALVAAQDIPTIDTGDLSELDMVLPSVADISMPAAPEEPDTDITIPDQPEDTGVEFYDQEIPLNSAVATKLLDSVQNGGTGLGPEIEASIWLRATVRLEEDRVRKIEEAVSNYADKGWEVPSGVLQAITAQVNNDYTRRVADISEQIAVEQAKLAQENTHFAIQQSIAFISITREWLLSKSNYLLERFKVQVDAWKTISDATLQELQAKIEVYKTESEAYRTQVDAQKIFIETKVQAAMAEIEEFKANVDFIIKREDLKLEREKQIVAVTEHGTQYGAQFTSQLAASALGAVNTVAQVNSSASISNSVGWSYRYGQDISEHVQNTENLNIGVQQETY